MKSVLILGNKGALGREVMKCFKSETGFKQSWMTYGFDMIVEKDIFVDVQLGRKETKETKLLESVEKQLQNDKVKFDCIISVAGGFSLGGFSDEKVSSALKSFQDNWKMNTESAFFAGFLANSFLKKNGLFILTGAKTIFENEGNDFISSYGISKSGVHEITKIMEKKKEFKTICILPNTLDTERNRKDMKYDKSWTDLKLLSKQIRNWAELENEKRPNDLFINKFLIVF
eukprot:maker-scaffold_24-snap-gene-5.55-mRNA-1 protein AED:0.03 eAED:0.03 QI:123/0.66/0.5/0.75/1/1/4/0/229